jgi:thiosulfate/3-mercaptopyruvate sulfurtransferase
MKILRRLVVLMLQLLPKLSAGFHLTPKYKSRRLLSSIMSYSSTRCSSITSISIPEALQLHGQDKVVFVDGSWFLNSKERNARQAFESGPRIQGAVFFDIDDIATPDPNLIHMMPYPQLFGATMDAMNITDDSTVIVYGQEQCPMVHRAWYTFLSMGHALSQTKVLDGSIVDWKAAGGPVEESPTTTLYAKNILSSRGDDNDATVSRYQATGPRQVVDMKRVLQVVANNQPSEAANTVIIDARSPERFTAKAPEPRENLRRGHMPGAKNVFFASLLRPDNLNRLASRDVLVERFANAGIHFNDNENDSINYITTCGSGATACTVAAAMIECGLDPERVSIYDGSWMEWGASAETPIVTIED